jgi:hypothetical protein
VRPIDHPEVIELAGISHGQGLGVHRDREVGAFTGHARTLDSIEPSPADLSQRVGSSLGGQAVVGPSRSCIRVHHGA